MARKAKRKGTVTRSNVRGFFRVQLVDRETGQIVGDSRWLENVITASGFNKFIVGAIGGISGSAQVAWLALARDNDSSIASADNALATEIAVREALPTGATDVTTVPHMKLIAAANGGTLEMCASWAGSTDLSSTVGGLQTVNCIGAFDLSEGGSMLCGNTFTASQWSTAQDVNATYQLQFSQT